MSSAPDIRGAVALLKRATGRRAGPVIVAIDGRSGAGKSTFARRLALESGAAVIEGDDFYRGGVGINGGTPRSRAMRCLDREMQRHVLEMVRAGRTARWSAFDWEAFDGRLRREDRVVPPVADTVILEGVYSARPDLIDLVDVAVLLCAPAAQREARLRIRDGVPGAWDAQWREAEDWYFRHELAGRRFDLILDN